LLKTSKSKGALAPLPTPMIAVVVFTKYTWCDGGDPGRCQAAATSSHAN